MLAKNTSLNSRLRSCAAQGNLLECITLIAQGASIRDECTKGRTALHYASLNNHVDVVRYLASKNAKDSADHEGLFAYNLTSTPEIKYVLMEKCHDDPDCIPSEVELEDYYKYNFALSVNNLSKELVQLTSLQAFQKFLSKYKLNSDSYIEGICLLIFIHYNYLHCNTFLEYLLIQGANPNNQAHAEIHLAYQSTALHSLLAHELIDRSKVYIKAIVAYSRFTLDCTIKDTEGKTVILMSALLGSCEIIKLFFQHFPDSAQRALNIPDNLGRTPAHYAYLFGHEAFIDLLHEKNADMTMTDKDGRTPIDMLRVNQIEVHRSLLRFHISPQRDSDFNWDTIMAEFGGIVPRSMLSIRTSSTTIYEKYIQNRKHCLGKYTEITEANNASPAP